MADEEKQSLKLSDGVKLSGVQVKLVGGELEVLREFGSKLKLECVSVGKVCKVCFCDGERYCLRILVLCRAT